MPRDALRLIDYLPCVPDFPKPGVMFRDISPLIADPQAFQFAITKFAELANKLDFTHILAIESRGFIFGAALANYLGKPLLLARKPNKLPLVTHTQAYGLEYGQDALEIQASLIPEQSSVLLIDDVIATGGTLLAAIALMSQVGAEISGAISLLEIEALGGNRQLIGRGVPAFSILSV